MELLFALLIGPITGVLETGCGNSDLVYEEIVSRVKVRSERHLALPSRGDETGRRLYIYSDNSWFLSLEFFSRESAALDVSCVVAVGTDENLGDARNLEVVELPEWKWGERPGNWPPASAGF